MPAKARASKSRRTPNFHAVNQSLSLAGSAVGGVPFLELYLSQGKTCKVEVHDIPLVRKFIRRWNIRHLPAHTRRFLAARVERLYFKGVSFDEAMSHVTGPFQQGPQTWLAAVKREPVIVNARTAAILKAFARDKPKLMAHKGPCSEKCWCPPTRYLWGLIDIGHDGTYSVWCPRWAQPLVMRVLRRIG